MGYDQHQQSNSSGAAAAIAVAVLLVAIFGVLALAGAWLFVARTDRVQVQTVTSRQQAVVEVQLTKAETQRAAAQVRVKDGMVQIRRSSVATTPDPRLNFILQLDREGNARIEGDGIGLDELRTRLARLQDETSNAFSVRINADPECPVKHIIPVLDVCEDVGDIDYRIVSPKDSDAPVDASISEN